MQRREVELKRSKYIPGQVGSDRKTFSVSLRSGQSANSVDRTNASLDAGSRHFVAGSRPIGWNYHVGGAMYGLLAGGNIT